MDLKEERTKYICKAYTEFDYAKFNAKPSNTLLVRPTIGKVKKSTYQLPKEDFVYGILTQADEADAKKVVHDWKSQQPPLPPLMARDFVKLNKIATLKGAVTAKEATTFRKEHDVRLKYRRGVDRLHAPKTLPVAVPEQGFGAPPPCPEKITAVISNEYQREWIEEHLKVHEQARPSTQSQTARHHNPAPTKASLGHSQHGANKSKATHAHDSFKLKQFSSVPPKVTQYMTRMRPNTAAIASSSEVVGSSEQWAA